MTFFKQIHADNKIFWHDLKKFFRRYFDELKQDRLLWWTFLFVMAGGIGLRIFFLIERPVGYDELDAYKYFARRSLKHVLSDYGQATNHIFHTFVEHVFHKALGSSHYIVLRLPAFLAGTFGFILTYFVGRVVTKDKWAGLLATVLVGISSLYICYSANARGYSMVTLFFLCLVLLGHYLLGRQNFVAWRWFVLLAAFSFYTTPSAIYGVVTIFVWMFVSAVFFKTSALPKQIAGRLFWAFLAIAALTAFLYSPVFVRVVVRDGGTLSGLIFFQLLQEKLSYPQLLQTFFNTTLKEYFTFFHLGFSVWMVVLHLTGALAGLAYGSKISNQAVVLWLTALVVAVVFSFAQRIILYARFFTPLVQVYFFVAAFGLCILVRWLAARFKKAHAAPLLAFTAIFLLTVNAAELLVNPKRVYYDSRVVDAAKLFPFLKSVLKPDDLIFMNASTGWEEEVFDYYLELYHIPNKHFSFMSSQKFDWNTLNGDIYLVEFDNKDNCFKYYHCESVYPKEVLISVLPADRYTPPLPLTHLPYTNIYQLKKQ